MLVNQFHAVSSNDIYSNEFKNNSINFSFQLAHKLSLQEYQYKEFNAPFFMTELKDSLKTSSNTAVGADNIRTELLKHIRPSIVNRQFCFSSTKFGLQVNDRCAGSIP